jgi:hypothetical protein
MLTILSESPVNKKRIVSAHLLVLAILKDGTKDHDRQQDVYSNGQRVAHD